MQQLAEEYWGKVDPTDNPILSAENGPSWIAQASYHSGMFERGEQEDARLFLSWIIDQFSQNVPATRTKAWQAQHQTLFQVALQPFDKCTVCGHVENRPKEVESMLNVGVFDTHKSIYEALQDTLIGKVDGVWCDNCRQTQAMYRASDIAAAPEILSIALQIMLPGGKVRHALKYPEILDLTVCQADSTRSLYYRLNAVVSHLGEDDAGHYIASVRSREPGRFTAISDDELEEFSRAEFLANPQQPQTFWRREGKDGFQVYMLMYTQIDMAGSTPLRSVACAPSSAARREQQARMTGLDRNFYAYCAALVSYFAFAMHYLLAFASVVMSWYA
jgi:hypothetical protein